MPFLGLKGNGLLAGVTCASGMGFILFGKQSYANLNLALFSCGSRIR